MRAVASGGAVVVGAIGIGTVVQPFIGGPGDGEVGTLAQVLIQLEGVVVTIVWAAVGTFIAGTIAKLVTGLRVSAEDEVNGLDIAEHGERAYN